MIVCVGCLLLITAFSTEAAMPQLCLSTRTGFRCQCTSIPTVNGSVSINVDCTSSNITVLPSNWTTSQLVIGLDLSRNLLTSLANEQFSPWKNLEDLSLSRNKLTNLSRDVFAGLTHLRRLDLSFNSISSLDSQVFEGLATLSELNLHANKLKSLHSQLFSPCPHLQSLNIGCNPELGRSLDSSLDAFIITFKNGLLGLKMDHMNITALPKNFFNEATNLTSLSIADNPIISLDIFPASLEFLDLSGIELELILPGDFLYYPSLKRLQLDRLLRLTTVERSAFEGLVSLEYLTMEGCVQLHVFNAFAFGGGFDSNPVPLKWLSLAHGGLHTLSSGLFHTLERTLKHLDLQNNPWDCDCRISWIRKLNSVLEDQGYLRCFSPEELHNKELMSVHVEDFVCKPLTSPNHIFIIMDAVLVMLACVVACIILYFLYRQGFVSCGHRQSAGAYSRISFKSSRHESC